MNALAFAPDWLLLLFRVFTLLITILAVYNAVECIYLNLGTKKISYTLFLGSLTSLFFIDISVLIESRSFENRVSFLAKLLGMMPCGVALLLGIALAIGNFFAFYKLICCKKNAITEATIKYTMDGMDDGICFFYENGETILTNIQMNKISSELFGTEIMNGQLFWKNILSGNYNSGTLLKSNPTIFIETADQKVWNMQFNQHYIKNLPAYSVTAYDVSEQSRLYREVKKRNTILSNMNQRLKEYNKEIKQVVAEKETLLIKTRVHDDLGRLLLVARKILSDPKNGEEKNELLNLWDQAVLVMKNEANPAEEKDNWELLMQAAKSVHVKIEVEGEIPKENRTRDLIIAAAHECLTNTVKHAKGDLLQIKIKNFDIYTEAQYFNNGNLPAEPIKESGGLGNLRKIVEQAGGTMKIERKPQFMLIIEVPHLEGLK